jgi:phage-related protein
MSTTIGRVDFVVGLDGTAVPVRARQIGRRIGREIGQSLDAELRARFRLMADSINASMRDMGREGGRDFVNGITYEIGRSLGPRMQRLFREAAETAGDGLGRGLRQIEVGKLSDDLSRMTIVVREGGGAMEMFARRVGDASGESNLLRDRVTSLGETVDDTSDRFNRFASMMNLTNGAFRRASFSTAGLTRALRLMRFEVKESDGPTKTLLERWKQFPHGARQFAFYVALFANLGESIATLSSAAGAGLLTLGATASFATLGLTAAIVAFTGLGGEIADLPKEIQPAVRSLRGLGDEFGELRKQLQIRTLRGLEGAFDSLRDTVRQLTPDFAALGDVTNGLITDFAEGMRPGTKNFERLRSLIRSSGPVFDRLARIVGRFGEGLLAAFSDPAMLRSTNEFLDWMNELSERFLAFVEGPGFEVWLDRASRVFGGFGDLLDATGRMLNNLVDEGAVQRLLDFMGNLEGFMPSLERMLDILGELDLFGLIAQLLNDFGEALAPLAPPMKDLAEGINAVVSSGIETLAPIFEDIATALAPFVQGLADFLNENPQEVANLLLALAGAAAALKVAGLASTLLGLGSALGGFAGKIKDKDWEKMGKGLGKAGAKSFLPALIVGLFSGEGGAGITIGTGALVGASAGPWGLAIGALIGAIISMFTDPGRWETGAQQIKDFFSTWWANITNPETWAIGLEQIGDFIAPFWEGILIKLGEGAQQIFDWWNGIWAEFPPEGSLLEIFTSAAEEFVLTSAAFFEGLLVKLGEGWTQITTFFTNLPATVQGIWDGLWTGLLTTVATWGANIATTWNALWAGFLSLVGAGLTNVGILFSGWMTTLGAGWSSFWGGIGRIFSGLWQGVVSLVSTGWRNLQSLFSGNFAALGAAWNGFWGQFGAVLSGVWGNIVSTVRGAVGTVVGLINGLIAAVNRGLDKISSLTGGLINLNLPSIPFASGGMVFGPTRALVGEAGPEAIVPLNRPLSQVDPAVRGLSAIAQGQSYGAPTGVGKVTNVEAGAIVVYEAGNGRQTASAIFDRLVAGGAQ